MESLVDERIEKIMEWLLENMYWVEGKGFLVHEMMTLTNNKFPGEIPNSGRMRVRLPNEKVQDEERPWNPWYQISLVDTAIGIYEAWGLEEDIQDQLKNHPLIIRPDRYFTCVTCKDIINDNAEVHCEKCIRRCGVLGFDHKEDPPIIVIEAIGPKEDEVSNKEKWNMYFIRAKLGDKLDWGWEKTLHPANLYYPGIYKKYWNPMDLEEALRLVPHLDIEEKYQPGKVWGVDDDKEYDRVTLPFCEDEED